MKILDINQLHTLKENCCMTIGFFDGVHVGHQKIIHTLIQKAKKENAVSVIITFDDSLILQFKMSQVLTTHEQKLQIFEKLGVDYVFNISSNDDVIHYTAKEFVEKILKKVCLKAIICGSDFSFGSDRLGNKDYLQENYAISIINVPDVIIDNKKISSTYIRSLLSTGNIKEANTYLYAPFSITSRVQKGYQIGRTIHFKTANLQLTPNCNVLRYGVYFGYANIHGIQYKTMINVGKNPTVLKDDLLHIEAFILHFNEDIYEELITISFLFYRREEIKFSSLEALKEQLNQDYTALIKFQ